ncbi:MAG TPA: 50S ribosomal protein L35 [Candidatus Dependentiae bacterium]|jgi:large subunit ribosomal protein L35|nr:50S ribosomal protein L35 [Candidatus Dependentiae bacterium]
MPKMKSRATAKKRFKRLSSGLVKYTKAFRRKKLTNKTRKTKRNLRRGGYVDKTQLHAVTQLLACR